MSTQLNGLCGSATGSIFDRRILRRVALDEGPTGEGVVEIPQTVAAVESYHMTPAIVAGLAARAGARALALTHLVPPNADTTALAREVRAAGYHGALLVGEDLMRLDVPERLLRWNGATIAY